MIKDILSGKGDISVELGLRPDRCDVLDCSLGYLYDGFNAIVKLGFPEHDGAEKGTEKLLFWVRLGDKALFFVTDDSNNTFFNLVCRYFS